MAEDAVSARLKSYLASQSAKVSTADLRVRLDEAAQEFLAAAATCDAARAHRRPAPGEWSVAEIVDHVTLTLEQVADIIRTLLRGVRPSPMTVALAPANADRPLENLLDRLRRSHAALGEVLGAQGGEFHTDVRVADPEFGEINWKGYALILRLHYKDHAQQIAKTLEVV